MTLDSSFNSSAADENIRQENGCFPKGIYVTDSDCKSASGIEEVSARKQPNLSPSAQSTSWSYLFLHNMKVDKFEQQVRKDGRYRCFIHRTYQYQPRNEYNQGVKRAYKPTISGLVFMQGEASELQSYLDEQFSPYHLVKDRTTGVAATIPDAQMQPFMRMMKDAPTQIQILDNPITHFADGRRRLRIVSGVFTGYEGYLVRIDRDRKLVMDLGGITIAIGNVHNEEFIATE